jgi:hypothetical protein
MSTPSSTAGDDTPTPVDTIRSDMSERLVALGFDPGIPVHEVEDLDFDLDAVKRALFESTYQNPITLPFRFRSDIPPYLADLELRMVVSAVQAYYEPYAPIVGMSRPLGCWSPPEWYVRGFLYKSGFDPYPEIVQMHVYLRTDGSESTLHSALVQVVRHPSGADPSTPLVQGKGIPGQQA